MFIARAIYVGNNVDQLWSFNRIFSGKVLSDRGDKGKLVYGVNWFCLVGLDIYRHVNSQVHVELLSSISFYHFHTVTPSLLSICHAQGLRA